MRVYKYVYMYMKKHNEIMIDKKEIFLHESKYLSLSNAVMKPLHSVAPLNHPKNIRVRVLYYTHYSSPFIFESYCILKLNNYCTSFICSSRNPVVSLLNLLLTSYLKTMSFSKKYDENLFVLFR